MTQFPSDIDLARLPKHVAIIMDGNGRWAKRQGLPRVSGHAQGHYTVRRVTDLCAKLGIPYLTMYAFSNENWTRPADEVSGLMSLIEHVSHEEIQSLHAENVRFNIIGRLHELPDTLRAELDRDMAMTRDNTGLTLTLAINYGGRNEIVDAVRAIMREGTAPEAVDDALIGNHLYTAGMPDPDLLIRSAGELRVSNYLLWQIAYAEIHVTEVLWPDFSDDDFFNAIRDYQSRTRKFGGLAA